MWKACKNDLRTEKEALGEIIYNDLTGNMQRHNETTFLSQRAESILVTIRVTYYNYYIREGRQWVQEGRDTKVLYEMPAVLEEFVKCLGFPC